MNGSCAFILAAGTGTRLRPSTLRWPKPLIPVAGVESLFFILCRLEELGIHRVFINSFHLAEKLNRRVNEWRPKFPKLEISIVEEHRELLGAGGGIKNLLDLHGEEILNFKKLLVLNADSFHGTPLAKLLGDDSADLLFGYSLNQEHLQKYSPLYLDQANNYAGFGKTVPPHNIPAHFVGAYTFNQRSLVKLKNQAFPKKSFDLLQSVFGLLQAEGFSVRGLELFAAENDFWFDLTDEAYLLEAQAWALQDLSQNLNQGNSPWASCLSRRWGPLFEVQPKVWCNRRDLNLSGVGPALVAIPAEIPAPKCHFRLEPQSSFVAEAAWPYTDLQCGTDSLFFWSGTAPEGPPPSHLNNKLWVY